MDDRDMSEQAVMERYKAANAGAVALSDRVTFEALMDIPRLLAVIRDLTDLVALKEETQRMNDHDL